MKTIQLRQLIDLVAGDVNDSESRIEKVFEWRFERDLVVVRWLLGIAASLALAVVVAFLRENPPGSAGSSGVADKEIDDHCITMRAIISAIGKNEE